MSTFLDAARELDELRRRVEQLEAIVRSRGVRSEGPPRTAYRPSEVAQMLGCTAQTVREMCQDGRLQAERMGRLWAITPAAVDRLLGNDQAVAS